MNKEKRIKVGDKVPVFSLKDQNGEIFSIENYIGRTAMVIYFYPKDDTPGCTKEACKFRDSYKDFTDLNVKVIGISADDVKSHKLFAEKYNLPFTLLADIKNEIRKLFGVKGNAFGLIPGRVTYIINDKGFVQHIYNSMFKIENHINQALKSLLIKDSL
ncbi:MAG: peroxiredoxin [Flavobacteriaceae bacterium]|nr:peroxiredoxin [Flavobacteriaceae bacterium]